MTELEQGDAGRIVDAKEIKVKIPVDYHIKLHTLKVLKGQSISDTVEIALQKYFKDFGENEGRDYQAVAERALRVFQS
ncbi:MAG TPA: hypothetical protein VM889_07190 [Candidatus Thermoplasmatota archaeon]|nr:hypothetical protein [Candidatus Thermoplasmatota archaeon]